MAIAEHDGDSGVQSVERALMLLEILASSPGEVGISELAKATSLPTATIHRLLATLVTCGYARRDPGSRKYAPGVGLVRLDVSAGQLFGPWTEPHLVRLVEATGETASLAVLDDTSALYVRQAPSPHAMRMITEVGRRALAHATATGKVLLAFQPRAVVEGILERTGLPACTVNTITERENLFAELDQVATNGFATDDEEEELGVRCVAVPVFGGGKPVAALSVSGPTVRLHGDFATAIVPEMHRVSALLSAALSEKRSGSQRPLLRPGGIGENLDGAT